jgi:hypothetical protein
MDMNCQLDSTAALALGGGGGGGGGGACGAHRLGGRGGVMCGLDVAEKQMVCAGDRTTVS